MWGHLLQNDSLAFGYKSGTSTTECSWLVMEVADYYRRHGSPPYACTLDASKGFDRCSWKVIFRRLLDRQLPAVAARVLMFIYVEHCQDILDRLRALEVGCHLPGGTFAPSARHPAGGILCGDTFVGVTIYTDDILLLAPTRSSLQLMVKEAEMFASSHNILFSTDPNPSRRKSKCLWFCGKSGEVAYPAPIVLNGVALPWVETANHLGHELHQICNMEYNARCKRASYIEKTTTIKETFDFARPEQKLSAISIYAGGMYGFALWDLFGQRAESAFKCWDTAVKLSWDCVPRSCHRWLVDSLLAGGLPSSRQNHLAMYAGFYRRLQTSAVP